MVQVFRVLGFVHHTGYLHIATQWQPTHAVFGLTVLRLELEEREPRVEEQVELGYTHFKKLCKKEVPPFVNNHQQR